MKDKPMWDQIIIIRQKDCSKFCANNLIFCGIHTHTHTHEKAFYWGSPYFKECGLKGLRFIPKWLIGKELTFNSKSLQLAFPIGTVIKNLTGNAGDTGDLSLTPGLGRSLGGGNDNPLHYFYLENPMDRGVYHWATWEI